MRCYLPAVLRYFLEYYKRISCKLCCIYREDHCHCSVYKILSAFSCRGFEGKTFRSLYHCFCNCYRTAVCSLCGFLMKLTAQGILCIRLKVLIWDNVLNLNWLRNRKWRVIFSSWCCCCADCRLNICVRKGHFYCIVTYCLARHLCTVSGWRLKPILNT